MLHHVLSGISSRRNKATAAAHWVQLFRNFRKAYQDALRVSITDKRGGTGCKPLRIGRNAHNDACG